VSHLVVNTIIVNGAYIRALQGGCHGPFGGDCPSIWADMLRRATKSGLAIADNLLQDLN
jgi:hypothetical protein